MHDVAALWLSADLSVACSGVALWRGDEIMETLTVGKKGRLPGTMDGWRSVFVDGAWSVPGRPLALVYEDGLMHHARVAKALSEHRGMVLGAWQMFCGGPTRRVNVQVWRKVARQTWGMPFPAHSAGCKELAQWLVRRHYGRAVGPDEADAVLVGNWAVKTGALARKGAA